MQTKKPRRRQIKNLAVDRVDAVDSPATGMKFLLFKSDDPEALREQAGLLVTALGGLFDAIAADATFRARAETLAQLDAVAKMLDRDLSAVLAKAEEAAAAPATEPEAEAPAVDEPETPSAQEAASGDEDGADDAEVEETEDVDVDEDEDDELDASAPSLDLDQLVAAIAAALEKPAARMEAAVRSLEKRLAALDGGTAKAPRKIIVKQQPSRQPTGQDEPIAKSRANGAAPELGKGLFRNIVFGQ